MVSNVTSNLPKDFAHKQTKIDVNINDGVHSVFISTELFEYPTECQRQFHRYSSKNPPLPQKNRRKRSKTFISKNVQVVNRLRDIS